MKLLLHICCAPCSIMCIETLRGEGIEPVGFWDNPNIHPFTEFRMRRNTLVDYAKEIGRSLVVEGGYGLRPFLEAVGLGLLMKQDVFGDFLNGAKDGMRTVIGIVPTLIGLMAAVGVLRSSGFLEEFGKLLGTVLEPAGIPSALVPLGVVRLFSNSAAVGLLLDLYKEAGCDSFAGRAASIMMSCTETVFYTMAVYFGAVHIKKTRYTLAGALLSSLVGMAVSIALAGLL